LPIAHQSKKLAGLRVEKLRGQRPSAVPFTPELRACLEAQRAAAGVLQQRTGRIAPTVFHRGGTPLWGFYKAWETACRLAGGTRSVLAVQHCQRG